MRDVASPEAAQKAYAEAKLSPLAFMPKAQAEGGQKAVAELLEGAGLACCDPTLVAGVLAMFTIIIAAMAIVFFKAEKTVRWPSTVIFLVAIPVSAV